MDNEQDDQHRIDNFDVEISEDHGAYRISITHSRLSRNQHWTSLSGLNRREMIFIMAAIAGWLAEQED